MAQLPRVLKHFNAYIDGRGYAGRCDAATLPAITLMKEDHRAAGMDGVKRIELGMEALQLSLTFSEIDPAILGLLGSEGVQLTLRGSVQSQGGRAEAVVVSMRGEWSGLEFGEWKPGAKTTNPLTVDVDYFRYVQDEVEWMEIDVVNMVRRVNGIDQLAAHRTNIGV